MRKKWVAKTAATAKFLLHPYPLMHSNTKWHAWLFSWNKSFLVITVICSCHPPPPSHLLSSPQSLCAPITAVWGNSSERERVSETSAKTARGYKNNSKTIVTIVFLFCLTALTNRHRLLTTVSLDLWREEDLSPFTPYVHTHPSRPHSLCPDELPRGIWGLLWEKKKN